MRNGLHFVVHAQCLSSVDIVVRVVVVCNSCVSNDAASSMQQLNKFALRTTAATGRKKKMIWRDR